MSISSIIFAVVFFGFVAVVAIAMWNEWTIRNEDDDDS